MTAVRVRPFPLSVAALVVVAAVAPVAVAGSFDRTATSGQPDAPRLLDAPYREHRGDVARVPVALVNGSAARLAVEGDDADYAATLTLRDGDGDGRVTLLFNSYAAGSDSPNATFRTAGTGDAVTVREESLLVGRLPAGAYGLRVGPAANATTATDRSTLRVAPADGPDVTVLTAAGEHYANLTSFADVAALRESGRLVEPPPTVLEGAPVGHVVPGDLLVLRVHAPGVAGAYALADGPSATARFRAVLGRELALRLVEHPIGVGMESDVGVFDLSAFDRHRVVADPGTDTYYVVLDTGAGAEPASDAADRFVVEGDAYAVHVGVPPSATIAGPDRANATATLRFGPPRPSVAVTGPDGTGAVTVVGTAGVPPGSAVVVALRGTAAGLPVERRLVVGAGGRFEVAFDLPSPAANATVAVVVRHDGERVAGVPATARPSATVDVEDVVTAAQGFHRPLVDEVETSHGGFVVVRRGSADGPVVGVSAYLAPGERHDVRLLVVEPVAGNATLVATVHRDSDVDGSLDLRVDEPYSAGDPVDAGSFVDLTAPPATTATSTPPASATPPTPPTVTPTATPPPTAASTPGARRSPSPTPSSGPVPGPGAGVAVLALLAAAALLSARRRG